MNSLPISAWLPITRDELLARGLEQVDVVLVSGDAYVDHPSMGHAVIARVIESMGLTVAILPQPNWRDDLRDFKKLGRPKKFFAVTSGNMDSMMNHYTAARRLRSDDAYSPGGKAGFRPDRAATVYTKILKSLYPDVPVILGGIEASMRRLSHYDYWDDRVMPSILVDSGADLLVYGMGERPIREIIRLLDSGRPFSSLTTVLQTAVRIKKGDSLPKQRGWKDAELPSHDEVARDKKAYNRAFVAIERESARAGSDVRLVQESGNDVVLVNPPYPTMTGAELDEIYTLPFTRQPHPKYKKRGAIPAFDMIRFSVNIHRGCFGACSFCTISAHQGRFITPRSKGSILAEIELIASDPEFRGVITDLGGPSANMYAMKGVDAGLCEKCRRISCIHPGVCSNLSTSHAPLLDLYSAVRSHPAVRKVTIGSGVRHDLLRGEDGRAYAGALVTRHVSGRLKIAPEHSEPRVLDLMRKPPFALFEQFHDMFFEIARKHALHLQLVPYIISGHPGCTLDDMNSLAARVGSMNLHLELVQEFTPSPMTRSTAMYYTGMIPETGEPIPVVRNDLERRRQKDSIVAGRQPTRS
ncbi:MAG: YgiQ family radical SAM protein [Myxococcota bacterium]|jgi:uncharacterized radical SAM protein YgiQ